MNQGGNPLQAPYMSNLQDLLLSSASTLSQVLLHLAFSINTTRNPPYFNK